MSNSHTPVRILYSPTTSPATLVKGVRGRPTHITGHSTWTTESPPGDHPSMDSILDPALHHIHAVTWEDGSYTQADKFGEDPLRARLLRWHRGESAPSADLPYVVSREEATGFKMPTPADEYESRYERAQISKTQVLFDVEIEGHVLRIQLYNGSFTVIGKQVISQ